MTARPWVTPQEVREYSELPAVQSRSEARLAVDIARAEQYVITYTHNDFAEEALPLAVKTPSPAAKPLNRKPLTIIATPRKL